MKKKVAIIILAAGKSTRMKSQMPKALHLLCGRTMLNYVLDLAASLKPEKTIAVLGYKHKEVKKLLPKGIKVSIQKKLIGTGDAVKAGVAKLKNFQGTVLVLYADNPLLKPETIKNLLKYHNDNNRAATLLTATLEKPEGYGRVLRDEYCSVKRVIEEKDADDAERDIKEINTGIICFDSRQLTRALKLLRPNNRKKEYYLTDAINLIYKNNGLIDNVKLADINEALGINSRVDLARANKIMQSRINEEWMKEGVTIVDPDTTFIGFGSKIGGDTVIYPFTVIENNVKIGKFCSIGPFAHLRCGTIIEDEVLVGNFLEIVRSQVGSKTLIKHFGYVGDTSIGKRANIGAGVVIANFDGKGKSKSIIKDDAFIGSDTVLISPVKVGKGSVTGAGSVVLKNMNIPDKTVVAGIPAKQLNLRKR